MKWFLFIFLYSMPCRSDCIKIHIDKDFGKQKKHLIKVALKDWERASYNKICFSTKEVDVSKPENFMHDNKITIYSGNHAWHFVVAKHSQCEYLKDNCLAITIRGYNFTSDIFIAADNNKFLSLIRHEIGHVLGLKHSLLYNDIMYSFIRNNMEISSITRIRLQCLIDNNKLLNWSNECE